MQDNKYSRAPSSILFGLSYKNIRNAGTIQISDQTFAQLTSFVNSTDESSFEEETILQYGLSSKFSFPMKRIKNDSTQILSPRLMIAYNGQEGRTEGDFFVGSDELTFGNIFSSKRYSSLSESEVGASISLGIDYSLSWSDQRSLDFSLGGLWLENSTYGENKSRGLDAREPSFLAGVISKKRQIFCFS